MTAKKSKRKIIMALGFCLTTIYSFSQGTQWRLLGNNNVTAGTNFLGTTNAQPIDFRTNNSQRMRIDGTTGFVGIGASFTSPLNLVDVRNGDINVGNGTAGNIPASPQAYKIGGNQVLWHKGNITNIFVGVGAGVSNTSAGVLGVNNTFVGSNAGANNTVGSRNTYLGRSAGQVIANSTDNVFIGFNSASASTSGNFNAFVGANSGLNNKASQNTFIGFRAGESNIVGTNNAFVGFRAGVNNTATDNAFIGSRAGEGNTTGTANTYVGARAAFGCTTGSSNVGIGDQAAVKIQTGDFNTYVGASAFSKAISGDRNVIVGHGAMQNVASSNNNVVIGDNAYANAATNTSVGAGNVMLGDGVSISRTANNNNIIIGNYANTVNGVAQNINNYNILIGSLSSAGNAGLNNAVAFGANTVVRANDKMILGDNNMNVGIGLNNDNIQNGPQNKLEINTGAVISQPALAASGLRFRDLTSASPVTTNPGLGVLGVSINGDVIYVPVNNGTTLGNLCSAPTQNPLTGDYEVPLNNHNFYFSGDVNNTDKVNVGFPCSVQTLGKLNITTAFRTNPLVNESYSVYSTNTRGNSLNNAGVYGEASTANNNLGAQTGLWGKASGGRATFGVHGEGLQANGISVGGFFEAVTQGNNYNEGIISVGRDANIRNIGVQGNALGGQMAIGGLFSARNASNINIAVSGEAFNTTLNPQMPTYPVASYIGVFGTANDNIANPNYAGYFDGNVFINGPMNGAAGYPSTSDQMFKNNIDSIQNAFQIIKDLKPRSFYFDTLNAYGLNFSSKKQYGFIAQDVNIILPELVNTAHKPAMADTAGNIIFPAVTYKTLNYDAFIGIIVKAMQQQQYKIDSLTTKLNLKDSIQDARLTAFETAITQCCSNANTRATNNTTQNQLDVELSDKDAIVLNQNVPNPFAEQTTITYNVPQSIAKAQILFYNAAGQIIQTVDIKTRGKGKVNVFASDLSSGLYHYTLVADGKVIDSKKMVRE